MDKFLKNIKKIANFLDRMKEVPDVGDDQEIEEEYGIQERLEKKLSKLFAESTWHEKNPGEKMPGHFRLDPYDGTPNPDFDQEEYNAKSKERVDKKIETNNTKDKEEKEATDKKNLETGQVKQLWLTDPLAFYKNVIKSKDDVQKWKDALKKDYDALVKVVGWAKANSEKAPDELKTELKKEVNLWKARKAALSKIAV